MAVVLIEGFDHLTAAELPAKGWSGSVPTMQAGRFDGQCARLTGSGSQSTAIKTLPSTYSTIFVGLATRMSNAAGTTAWLNIRTAAAATVMTLGQDASGHILIKNSGGTTIATGTTVIASNAWNYIEVKLVINGASGTVEVHLNGATEIAQTTGNFGSTNAGNLLVGSNGNTTSNDFDDMYVIDTTGSAPRNTFLGDVRVETIYPTADGAHTAWTPNSGSTHWTQVSEAQADGDTTYVSDLTPGDIDSYVFGDIDTGATVYGLQTNLYARKDDANTRQIAPVVRQSGSDNVGTTVTMSASYAVYSQIYNQDPSSADWTPTTVNADEFGVKEIA